MKNMTFQKTKLATTMSLLLGLSVAMPTMAQEDDADANLDPNVEVITVKGIRGSLVKSSDIKRSNQGVVDAIVAEEMGKFPDTNLAESLQRITGVSVSRANGEGSQITVRGFGPDFNLVTLNGRQMPSTGFSRSFNFENFASEGVSALEVYKTARADIPTGGLGATVNIVTARPLAQPGQQISLTAKANYDTSNVEGEDVTPEIAALVSKTFLDDRLGVALTGSFQRRDFQKQQANIQGWQANVALPDLDASQFTDARAVDESGAPIQNFFAPNADGVLEATSAHFFPKDLNYGIENVQRERTNAQATIQFAATDNLTLTADYTMSNVVAGSNSIGWGIWNNFGGNVNSYQLDENGTALFANISGDDGSFTASRSTTEFDMESFGFNVDFQARDDLKITLDYHDSNSTIDNGIDPGLRSAGQVILGSAALDYKEYSYLEGDIPQFVIGWNNGTNQLTANEIDSNFSQFIHSPGESDIQQVQLDVEYLPEFDFAESLVKLSAGVSNTQQTLIGTSGWSGLRGGPGFNPSFPQIFPDNMFTLNGTGSFLDQFAGGGSALSTDYYWTYDFDEAVARQAAYLTADVVGSNEYVVDPYYTTNTTSSVEETTTAFYINSLWEFDVKDVFVQINAGIRYEETDVISPSQSNIAEQVNWVASSEWITSFSGIQEVSNEGGYDLLLPMVDIRVDLTDDLVSRVSFGKSVTRAPLGNLLGGLSLSGSPKIGSRTGSRGNTNLKPYQSTNFDISLEYYYDEGSYASVGLFWKQVDDWIETSTVDVEIDGLYDVYLGPRWNEAVANITNRGDQATDTAIFDEMLALGYGNADGQIEPDPATDSLITWRLSSPENVEERKTNGIELAVQHLFQDTGFGIAANATFVDGDVDYNPYVLAAQKALSGLSDSANFQAFYEDEKLSVRLTYAWRDSYLIGQGQGQGTSDVPPQFAKEYGQWDMSVNYDIDENFTVFVEGINLNNETEQHYGRFEEQFLFAGQYGPRYSVGVRVSM
ncbi:TonB-dependent receptor [Alteromonas sp. W364]|jgi:TonB-dependent receptor|uniref:TonB-dependent receptor n=1 Tax=Alteromonas sp. W364 TaxID=3075610 RepID=UPI00288880BD|nr:TonB-dependent receptor [Alteromonas sp. W364]MDT0629279.1 TonB-dependent receptor [Alteromonas sp. W364]